MHLLYLMEQQYYIKVRMKMSNCWSANGRLRSPELGPTVVTHGLCAENYEDVDQHEEMTLERIPFTSVLLGS